MRKLLSNIWRELTKFDYHPEKHYMRGHVENYLASSSDLCDLEMRQKQFTIMLVRVFTSLSIVSIQYSHLYAVLH